jgi:hypothetical protein
MTPNVRVLTRVRGEITQVREVHNTWTQYGRQYLAEMATLASYGPDTPVRNDRIKYIGFGIGGKGQNQLGMANAAPWSVTYPAGADPNATTGNQYDDEFPVDPPIGTLERPVNITGGGLGSSLYAFGPAPGWISPEFDKSASTIVQPLSHPDSVTTRFFAQFRQGVGTNLFGDATYFINDPWTGPNDIVQMPLSEAGLFLSSANLFNAFEPVVAYVTFPTVQITIDTDLEIEWDVRF